MTEEPIYILGQSNFALGIILDILKLKGSKNEIFIVPNIPDNQNTSSEFAFKTDGVGHKVISLEAFKKRKNGKYVIGSIGKGRERIWNFFVKEFGLSKLEFINLIHPTAVVPDTATLGNGIHIGPLSVISPFAVLGDFTTINRSVSIGHHTVLKDFACINPGVNIAGICKIGYNTTLGIGSTVVDKTTIGQNTIIGAGSVVTRSIPDNVVAYGSPAKVIKDNI